MSKTEFIDIQTNLNTSSLSVQSSNTDIATAQIVGSTLCVDLIGGGECTVTVSVDDSNIDYIKPDDKSINVSLLPKADMTPSEIQRIAREGQASNTFAVGDLFLVQLSGEVWSINLTGIYYAAVIGINHNKGIEGDNIVHFSFPHAEDGKGLAFIDSVNYRKALGDFKIYNYNSGGWNNSKQLGICIQIYTSCIASPRSPWEKAIYKITKYRDNEGNSTYSELTCSSDFMWLLSVYEILGKNYYSNPNEADFQKQYDYYKNGLSPKRYKHDDSSVAVYYWLASPYSNTGYFFRVNEDGTFGWNGSMSYGITPCFAVG